jgi:U2 small nuclear ribonucleoprotein A'
MAQPPGGPRALGRLTADLVLRSPQHMNCVHQYELDLRGNRITVIENLGATEGQFDCIDLSDNAIVRLEGLPKLPRLAALHLAGNRVARVARGLGAATPALEWLTLTSNRLAAVADLEPLGALPRLKYLSLIDNPVTAQPGYRAFLIARCKRLKVLDFRKVGAAERAAAEAEFPAGAAPPAHVAAAAAPAGGGGAATSEQPSTRTGPSAEQTLAIKAAIASASTLEEVRRLEEALKGGRLPGEGGAAAMEEG